MFTKPVVFVLGAGISAPFGFPVGRQMKDAICNGGYRDTQGNQIPTLSPSDMADVLMAAMNQTDAYTATEFINAFRQSDLYSIDAWLETNQTDTGVMNAGKCAIAVVLMYAERLAMINGADVNDDWFSWLWNNIWTPDIAEIADNDIHFLTFNYDRLFEWKLKRQIENSYLRAKPEEHQKAFRILTSKIHHIHGVLASGKDGNPDLSRFGQHDLRAIMTGNPTDHAAKKTRFGAHVAQAAKTINIVCENPNDDKIVNTAQSIIYRNLNQKEARLIFLGFSFDERNIIKLNLDRYVREFENTDSNHSEEQLEYGKIVGSARGLLRGERSTVSEMLDETIALGSDTMGAVDFCRSYLRSPSSRMADRRAADEAGI